MNVSLSRISNLTRGFSALMSVLIVSAVLTLMVFSASTAIYQVRMAVSHKEDSVESESLAISCVHLLLLDIALGYEMETLEDGKRFTIGDDQSCFVDSVEMNRQHFLIRTSAKVRDSMTKIEAEAEFLNGQPVLNFIRKL